MFFYCHNFHWLPSKAIDQQGLSAQPQVVKRLPASTVFWMVEGTARTFLLCYMKALLLIPTLCAFPRQQNALYPSIFTFLSWILPFCKSKTMYKNAYIMQKRRYCTYFFGFYMCIPNIVLLLQDIVQINTVLTYKIRFFGEMCMKKSGIFSFKTF